MTQLMNFNNKLFYDTLNVQAQITAVLKACRKGTRKRKNYINSNPIDIHIESLCIINLQIAFCIQMLLLLSNIFSGRKKMI